LAVLLLFSIATCVSSSASPFDGKRIAPAPGRALATIQTTVTSSFCGATCWR
jgi:hypothetical protein